MKPNWWLIVKLVLIAKIVALSAWFYPLLPETVPIHWNAAGEIDGYGHKFWSVLLIPIMVIVLQGLFWVIPKIDPNREKYKQFVKAWQMFQIGFLIFMLYLHSVILYLIFHPQESILPFMQIGLGVFFVLIGNYMGKIRQNYFFGIRTPWTLKNEEVWNKTHRLGGWCFVVAGLLFLVNTTFQWQVVLVFIVALFLAAVVPIVYSYVLYRKIVAIRDSSLRSE